MQGVPPRPDRVQSFRVAYNQGSRRDRLRLLREISEDGADCSLVIQSSWFLKACRNCFMEGVSAEVREESPWFAYVCKKASVLLTKHPELCKLNRGRGRPSGVSNDMIQRAKRAAAFLLCGWTQTKMSPYLFPGTLDSVDAHRRNFFSHYRLEIGAWKKRLTLAKAKRIVRRLTLPADCKK